MWPKLMDVLDEGPLDRFASAARYLDVTLAVARDVLVAHRDPDAFELPSYSSWGAVQLHRPVIDEGRRAAAEQIVRDANRGFDHPWPDWGYDHLIDTITAVPQLLDRSTRDALRRAYRQAGFDSPQLQAMMQAVTRMLTIYREAVAESPAPS